MNGSNTDFLLGWPIFRGYVSFKDCNLQAISQLPAFWRGNPFCLRYLTFHNFGYAANPAKQFAEGDEVLVFPAQLVPNMLGNGGGDELEAVSNEIPHQQKSRTKIQDGVNTVNTCLFWKLKNSWILMIWRDCFFCCASSSLVHFQPF